MFEQVRDYFSFSDIRFLIFVLFLSSSFADLLSFILPCFVLFNLYLIVQNCLLILLKKNQTKRFPDLLPEKERIRVLSQFF